MDAVQRRFVMALVLNDTNQHFYSLYSKINSSIQQQSVVLLRTTNGTVEHSRDLEKGLKVLREMQGSASWALIQLKNLAALQPCVALSCEMYDIFI